MKKGLGTIPKGLSWVNSEQKKPKREPLECTKTSQKGLVQGWTRATFIIKQELCDQLKALAYWDRRTVKEIIDEALSHYLENKKIKAIPAKKVY
jgi:hypothetical protein